MIYDRLTILFHIKNQLFDNCNELVCVTVILSLLSQAVQYFFLTFFVFFFVTFAHLLLQVAEDLVMCQIFCFGLES